jgi:hypothetical protein
VVARAVLELSHIHKPTSKRSFLSTQDTSIVYHVQNPRLFHWTRDLLPALRNAGLKFETLSQREWIHRLRNSEKNPELNPTIKLVDFFAKKYDNDNPGRKDLVFWTAKTQEESEAIRNGYDIIGSGIVKKFIESWKIAQ